MAILLIEIPTSSLPCGINPAKPFVARDSGKARIVADVSHDSAQVIGVADDAVEAFLLPQFAGLAGRGVDVFAVTPFIAPIRSSSSCPSNGRKIKWQWLGIMTQLLS